VTQNQEQPTQKLSFLTKLIYGSGDWSMASFNTIRQIFYAIFLTDTVGLHPQLASLAALIGIIWDAANDPLVGSLSDSAHTKWGRRRPFLLLFSIPFGLAFVLLWWAPPWNSQFLLFLHVTAAYMLTDTLQTLVVVPFLTLTPELTQDYDERTSLTTFRMLFNLLASLAAAAGAPEIVASFANRQTGYLVMSAIFGALSIFPYLLIFITTRERFSEPRPAKNQFTPLESFTSTWKNGPFRIATTINLLNWVTFDLVALMLPFFIRYWIDEGNLTHQIDVPPIGMLTTESLVFLILLTTAILALPLWSFLAQRWNKRNAYIVGMLFWAVVQLLIITIKPGQLSYILILAIFAGISVATAHVLPNALFPDVLEWDEIKTGQRRDGIYYGILNLTRKLASALTIFAALQALGIFGYQTPPANAVTFTQPAQTLLAIRVLTGPAGAILLIGAIVTAFFYPVSRETHARMRYLLAKRRARQLAAAPLPPDR
jgi:GPH family glycoside/pentoside/hexuronide:cation symporter